MISVGDRLMNKAGELAEVVRVIGGSTFKLVIIGGGVRPNGTFFDENIVEPSATWASASKEEYLKHLEALKEQYEKKVVELEAELAIMSKYDSFEEEEAAKVLVAIGISNPTKAQVKELAAKKLRYILRA